LSGHLAIEGKELDMHTFAEKTKVTQQTNYAKPTISGRAHFGQSPEVRSILQSRRAIGNQAVQPRLQAKPDGLEAISSNKEVTGFADDFSQLPVNHESSANVQAKLTLGPPGDIHEQEAERVSEDVVRMPEPQLQRACARGGGWPTWRAEQSDQVHERIQNKCVGSGDPGHTAVPPIVHDVLRSSGQALDAPTRAFMEPRFGRDFSRVRVHLDAAAEQSARDLNANAYTVGHHIVFGAGRLAPDTYEGRRLIAHELTHVVQQSSISDAGTAASMHGAPVIHRQPAQARPTPVAEAWTKVEKGAYTNIVAAQNELDELVADFKNRKLSFDDERIKRKLERAFLYLREAWRTSVPMSSHVMLEAAMASYSRASEAVGVYVVFLPETAAKEDARFWLDNLRWLETRMTPVKRPPAPAQAVTDLRQDMERQIDNWKEACRAGIGEFIHGELASRIDALSEGSWESFFQALVGNTVWAAAAFVPAGAPAFAVSMVGIAIASGPTVPKKGTNKDELAQIESRLHIYIEKIHEKLNKQLPTSAATLLMEHPGVSLEEGLKLFLEASFKPGMIKHNPTMIDVTAVRQTMRESAAYSLALLKEIRKVRGTTGEIHTFVSWLSPPDFGKKKLAVVESAPIGSGAVVKFLRWVPEENEAIALMTQGSQPIGIQWYGFEQQGPSPAPLYLQWLMQHGWKTEDGFGLEWFKRKEEKSKNRTAKQ
jgi:hypothetical protein